MKILRDYLESELDLFRKECNFTESELEYFNLKASDKSNVQISLEMQVSTSQVSKLAKRVKDKITKLESMQ